MCLAIPGKLLNLSDAEPLERTGVVDFDGIQKEISLACVPEATVGCYLLVHAGFALTVIDEPEAKERLAVLAGLHHHADGETE